jgi:hypothetical protein
MDGPRMSKDLSLGSRQELLAECLGKFLVWAFAKGWKVRLGEGLIKLTDARDGDYDGPHKKDGGHYNATAQDVNLFINDEWIKSGSHPAWKEIDSYWRSLHSLCRTGLSFGDPNHLAVVLRVLPDGREVF